MEIVSIEAKTFEEMNEALKNIANRVQKVCGTNRTGSMDSWIDNQEACILMDISPSKMLTLRRNGVLPYSHIERKVYYKREDIIQFMEKSLKQGISKR